MPIDRRGAFRARCLAIARARADGSESEVAALFHPGTDEPGDMTAPAPAAESAPMLLVPGLLGDGVSGLVAPFGHAREALVAVGRDIQVAWVGGRSGCTRNAARLRTVVLERAAAHGAAIDLVGYSKGCTDALHMLGDWPDTRSALRSLTSLGGVVRGTPLARRTPPLAARVLGWLPLPDIGLGFGRGDGQAVADLMPERRARWLDEHPLPDGIRYASIVAAASPKRVSRVLKPSWRTLSRTDPDNDSQVIACDAMLPQGELLATLDADHWALALPIAERSPLLARLAVNRNDFPRAVLLEALMDHLASPIPQAGPTGTARDRAVM